MTITQILEELERAGPEIPRAALQQAVRQRDAITPSLLSILEQVAENPRAALFPSGNAQHLYALYLLAHFRESRAARSLVQLFRAPAALAGEVWAGHLAERGPVLLASICGAAHLPLLKALALDEGADSEARRCAVDACAVLVSWGELLRRDAIAWYRELFQSSLERPGDPYLWGVLVNAAYELNARELLPEIRAAFHAELVDESFIDVRFVESWAGDPTDNPYADFAYDHQHISDVVAEFEAASEAAAEADDEEHEDVEAALEELDELPDPFADDGEEEGIDVIAGADGPPMPEPETFFLKPRVQPNAPCPCGSGRTFKSCCGKRA